MAHTMPTTRLLVIMLDHLLLIVKKQHKFIVVLCTCPLRYITSCALADNHTNTCNNSVEIKTLKF